MNEAAQTVPVRTGEKTIDSEHDVQMQLLDSLSHALQEVDGLSPANYILDQFVEFSDMHFLSEQLVMRLHGYPGYEPHLEEHTRLMKKVREIRSTVNSGEAKIGFQLVQQLREWLLTHIAIEDVTFGEFLRSKEGKTL
ncbi:MAG TPA: bacteriohemerythrin [Candidatus Acidoferrum sp.]|jgi:hemerythrin